MKPTDFDQFALRTFIRAPADEIQPKISTPKGLNSWFCFGAEFRNSAGQSRAPSERAQKGDTFSWYDGASETLFTADALPSEAGFGFRWQGAPIATLLTLEPRGRHTMAHCLVKNLPTEDDALLELWVLYYAQWTFKLTNLKSVVEKAHDLREYEHYDPYELLEPPLG